MNISKKDLNKLKDQMKIVNYIAHMSKADSEKMYIKVSKQIDKEMRNM